MSPESELSDRIPKSDPVELGSAGSLELDPRFMLEFAPYEVWTAHADKEDMELFFREMKSRCERAIAYPSIKLLPSYAYISDLHGNADSWHTHLQSMIDHGVDRIIVLGDVIDRGSQSLNIFEDIVEGVKQNKMIFVKGNHEDFLLKSIDGNREVLIEWAQNGGDKTLSEFGINIRMGYQKSFIVDMEDSGEDTSMSDRVFERLLARHSQSTIYVGDEISDLNAISSNLKLREIASWLQVNSKNCAVDIYGNLANHTGNISSKMEKALIEMMPKPRIIHGHEERMDVQSACSSKINIDIGARFWLFVGQEGIFFVNQKGEKIKKGALSSRVFLNQVGRRIAALSGALVKD